MQNNFKKNFSDFYQIRKLRKNSWPETLKQIHNKPKNLKIAGNEPDWSFKRLCVVGSRKNTEYGEKVCKKIISELSGFPISIVSGLAYGIDKIAHESALENGLNTIAIPGSGLSPSVIYPRANFNLAKEIIEKGGCLISEFSNNETAKDWMFPQRNRIMVAISDATLIIEASEKSGTMITAFLTTEYDHELMAIPGSVFDSNHIGCNKLIKSGAHVICSGNDVLDFFNFKRHNKISTEKIIESLNLSDEQKIIVGFLNKPISMQELLEKSHFLKINTANIVELISILEINNIITIIDGKIFKN